MFILVANLISSSPRNSIEDVFDRVRDHQNITFDMRSSAHIDNKGKDILILGKGLTLGLNCTTFTTEAKYPINFTQSNRTFCLSLHCNGSNSFIFVNARKIYQFKEKDSEIIVIVP